MGRLFSCAWRAWFIVTVCLMGLWTSAKAQPETISLPHLGLNPQTVTVSGFSSGGFMAVQMHVAHSSFIKGAAIFAGGPFGCAANNRGVATLIQATRQCVNMPISRGGHPLELLRCPPLCPTSLISHTRSRIHRVSIRCAIWLMIASSCFRNRGSDCSPVCHGSPPQWYTSFVPEHQIDDLFTLPAGHGSQV